MTETSYTQSARYRRCQTLFDRRYPNFENAGQRYARWVGAAVGESSVLLDVGCGRTSLAAEAIRAAAQTAGIDLSPSDLRHNDTVRWPILANAERLPFPDAHFDVIISQWVVEHFDAPEHAFREMARVLRPGGQMVVLTTNALNYIPLFSRLVPERARRFALNRLLRRPTHESHPTRYRANTGRALRRVAERAGLRLDQCDYAGNPFYLAFSLPLFRVALAYERLTDWHPLRPLKLYLLATLRKPGGR